MGPFLGIVKLTIKTALRSNIFQLLLLVLLFCITFIPTTIAGDGTAQGYIQVSLKYSLAAIGFILSLSSIWLGCFMMSRDTETYQIHMVVSKSVSRTTVWLGKWFGIVLIHLSLLLLSAATIYFIVSYQYHRQDFSEKERVRIQNEVMVARRVYYPKMPNMDNIAKQELTRRVEMNKKIGKEVDESSASMNKMLQDIKREVIGNYSQIPFNSMREWSYEGLPINYDGPVFLRFRLYVNKIGGNDQRLSNGLWIAGFPVPEEANSEPAKNVFEQKSAGKQKYKFVPQALSNGPEQIMTGEFHERVLDSRFISPDGMMLTAFQNSDPQRAQLFFQPADGPKILISASNFTDNYFRAVLVLFLQLVIMAGLGCAAASVLSMPMAIFVVISYVIAGSFSIILSGSSYISGVADHIGYYMGNILLLVIIPMQAFEITHFVSGGELIEFKLIGTIFLKYFILRALPLFILGIWLYNRREMGLVIRK